MKRILGPALATLTLAACGGWDTPPRAIATPSTAAASTDCGTFDLPQGESLPDSAVRCLVEAVRAGRPARLQVTRPTVEGDPIPVTYTAGTDGRVEVITDSRQDSFGTPIITRETCTGPILASQLEFAECSEPIPVGK